MEQTVYANGAEVAYRFDGPEDGPVVMLSNSLASTYAMWDAQIPALTDKYRVLRYDQRGHGGSEATEPPYRFDMLLDDACGLLAALGIDKVHFCGLSMGGMTGQLFGAKRPELLHSLILCDTASKMPDPAVWDAMAAAAREDGMPSLVEPILEGSFSAHYRASDPDEVARVGAMIGNTHPDGFVGCCHAIKPMDHTPLLAGIETPTLIIVGEHDANTTVEHSEIIHREIAGSKLVVIENAAHFPNIERPDAFNSALRAFLDTH